MGGGENRGGCHTGGLGASRATGKGVRGLHPIRVCCHCVQRQLPPLPAPALRLGYRYCAGAHTGTDADVHARVGAHSQ